MGALQKMGEERKRERRRETKRRDGTRKWSADYGVIVVNWGISRMRIYIGEVDENSSGKSLGLREFLINL
jgi:hypothetical protein